MKSLIATALLAWAFVAYGLASVSTPDTQATIKSMTVVELEKAGDSARAQKDYQQAISYLSEATRKDPKNPKLFNKLGLAQLKAGDFNRAMLSFMKCSKLDRKYPDAWNNIGAVYYVERNYVGAAKYFKKAVALDETRASFHVNLGAAWFAQNNLDSAMREYTRALELDPDVLVSDSRVGVAAQITTPEERAKHEYMLAKIYARMGNVDSCLRCLQRAKENGYHDLAKVYNDEAFVGVRQDTRLAQIVPPPPPK